ncbi:MAG: hypothetical protein WBQ60_03440 [Asticcacaulis sp.]
MKQIWPLFCIALLTAPLGAVALPASAASLLDAAPAVVIKAGYVPGRKDRDEDRRGNSRNSDMFRQNFRDDRRSAPQAPAPQPRIREMRRDDRINQAMSIGRSRGHVLDAGPQGGSVFWVRVATDRGRVDLLVDTDSGRIIGER